MLTSCLEFTSFLKTQRFSDLTIGIVNTEKKVHKCILAAVSEIFFTLISKMPNSGEHGRVKILDFHSNVVKEMLRFIYDGDFNEIDKCIDELTCIGDDYGLPSKKTKYKHFLLDNLMLENIYSLVATIEKYTCAKLIEGLIKFIVSNKEKIDNPDINKS